MAREAALAAVGFMTSRFDLGCSSQSMQNPRWIAPAQFQFAKHWILYFYILAYDRQGFVFTSNHALTRMLKKGAFCQVHDMHVHAPTFPY